jgi:hypothetical protein
MAAFAAPDGIRGRPRELESSTSANKPQGRRRGDRRAPHGCSIPCTRGPDVALPSRTRMRSSPSAQARTSAIICRPETTSRVLAVAHPPKQITAAKPPARRDGSKYENAAYRGLRRPATSPLTARARLVCLATRRSLFDWITSVSYHRRWVDREQTTRALRPRPLRARRDHASPESGDGAVKR